MRIRRIEIPAYRVLRDVDMRFDAGHVPQIFPIGSQNGGGKSTLLQVLFVLLHCAGVSERRGYLRNLLVNGACAGDGPETVFARLSLEVAGRDVQLEFAVLRFETLVGGFGGDVPPVGFEVFTELENAMLRLKQVAHAGRANRELAQLLKTSEGNPGFLSFRHIELLKRAEIKGVRADTPRVTLETVIREREWEIEREHGVVSDRIRELRNWRDRIESLLSARGEVHLVDFSLGGSQEDLRALVARVDGATIDKASDLLTEVSRSIFLLGPSNQQYLFLDRSSRRAFVHAASIDYLRTLAKAEANLPAFFAYDWLSLEPLIKLFSEARDRDFEEVVKSGSYGSHYTSMLADVNALLATKRVRPLPDLDGIEFTTRRGEDDVVLGPEDLSRGELKRLMIYAWLKANNATDAVVLIDEVEASFHPDWQYRIIRDLQEWAPGNQYLLATHSYELCTALTPAHVRALEPRLREGRPGDDPDES